MKTTKPSAAMTVAAAIALFGCQFQSDTDSKTEAASDIDANNAQSSDINNPLNAEDTDNASQAQADWQLVWSDEFSGNSIDPAKWSFEVNCWGGGNNEQQCYTTKDDNAFVEDGILNIVAIKEDHTGPAATKDSADYDPTVLKTLPYTSARLRTKEKGDWTYGRIEARIKLPAGQGTWPAFWMLPTDNVYGGWAASGEIDIMEAVNIGTLTDTSDAGHRGQPERRVYGTLHYGRAWPENVNSGTHYWLPNDADPSAGFHTYAVEWEEGEIRWYVDDVHYATQRASGWYSQYVDDNSGQLTNAPDNAPFNERFHIILNLAVGGAWAGAVNDTGMNADIFPQTMQVDYVRVYQCSVDSVLGQGCATVSADAELLTGNTPPEMTSADESLDSAAKFTLFDDALHNALTYRSYDPDNTIQYNETEVSGRGNVLQITKTGSNGNVYFEYSPRIDLSQWQANADLVFDLHLLSRAAESTLAVKLDSGWPKASPYQVPLPALNQWQEVRIPLADILKNENPYSPGSFADANNVLNVFVVEPSAAMTLQLDNIRYETPLASRQEAVLFTEEVNIPFTLKTFSNSGSLSVDLVSAADTNHGNVVQFSFDSDESVGYFHALPDENGDATTYDLSSFERLEFDLLVVADPRTTRIFNIKMDCGHLCTSGDFPINTPEVGVWTHYQVSLADLQANPGSNLDLTQIDSPFFIFPDLGNQQGVILQVDNLKLHK